MKIYIPNHLRQLKIVNQLCKMIEKYNDIGYKKYTDPYEYYYSSVNNDPVKKFIGICLSDHIKQIEELENIVNYFTKFFYSIKGCNEKIIDSLKTRIGLDIETYEFKKRGTLVTLNIELNSIPEVVSSNEKFFMKSLVDFLESLILLDTTYIIIKTQKLVISDEINVMVQSDLKVFNVAKINAEEAITITI